jgi:hypothetical protein
MLSPHGLRVLIAFLLAPLAAPLAFSVVVVFIGLFGPHAGPSFGASLDLVLTVFAVGAPLAYAAALLAGGPIYLALRMLGLVHRVPLWIAGAAIGAMVGLVLAPHLRGDLFSIRFSWWAAALLGVVSAESFLRLLGEGREREGIVTN